MIGNSFANWVDSSVFGACVVVRQTLDGLFASWKFAPKVAIHSFEPSPASFAMLRKSAESLTAGTGEWSGTDVFRKWTFNNTDGGSRTIALRNIGVGPEPGDLTFYCPKIDTECKTEKVSLMPSEGTHTFKAKVKTLATLVPEITLPDDELAFLKIDAQGYDCEILHGLDFDAHRFHVLLWEVFWPFLVKTKATTGRCSLRSQVDLFANKGYRVYVMNPVAGPVRIDGAFYNQKVLSTGCMNMFAVSNSWPHNNELLAHYASFTIKEAWEFELIMKTGGKAGARAKWKSWETNDDHGLTKTCADGARTSNPGVLWTATETAASEYVASLMCDL